MADDAIKLSWHQNCLADGSVLHHLKLLRLSLKLLRAAALIKYSPAFVMQDHYVYTDMHRLTTGLRSEKYVVRRFRRCANVIECIYKNLDNIAHY